MTRFYIQRDGLTTTSAAERSANVEARAEMFMKEWSENDTEAAVARQTTYEGRS